jgi:hypothetical protein
MFVKDDHSYTRGVGAVASMDAASSARRRAAARAELEMARRDRIMSLGATWAARVIPTRMTTKSTSTIETGQESAFSRPPPVPPKTIPLPRRPRGLDAIGVKVKLPGSVMPTRAETKVSTVTTAPPASSSTAALPPTKAQVSIVAGGSGTSWVSGASKASASAPEMDNPPPPFAPEPEPTAPSAPSPKTSSNLLMYAALGIGAIWLLTRSK